MAAGMATAVPVATAPAPPSSPASSSAPTAPPSTTPESGGAPGLQSLAAAPGQKCPVNVATEPSLRGPTASALAAINGVTPHLRFTVADAGPISISFGGEWPVAQPPLGWTAPDRRTILINPDHPGSTIDAALADIIVHELGHVLIGPAHVDDGTVLDPQIDGRISIGAADRAFLGELTCADLGL